MEKDYSTLVGMIGERNRPSGGIKSVHEVIMQCSITSESNILEIGSNTGFTSVQLARLTGATVKGIDVNGESIAKATQYAREHKVEASVEFINASATSLPFEDESFDMVWASNVTSFIEDKNKAIEEYIRVLKLDGYLAFVPIYYVTEPPQDLVESVGKAIGVDLKVYKKEDWINMFFANSANRQGSLDLVYEQDYMYHDKASELVQYVDFQMNKLKGTVDETQFNEVKEKYTEQMSLFNSNLGYAGYSVLVLQKNAIVEDPELFTTYKV